MLPNPPPAQRRRAIGQRWRCASPRKSGRARNDSRLALEGSLKAAQACMVLHALIAACALRPMLGFMGNGRAESSVAGKLQRARIDHMKAWSVRDGQVHDQLRQHGVPTNALLVAPPGRVCMDAAQLRPRLPQALHAAARQRQCQRRRCCPGSVVSSQLSFHSCFHGGTGSWRSWLLCRQRQLS